MSLSLDLGTRPEGTVASMPTAARVQVGSIDMSTEDFCQLAMYVLTNTNLVPSDPRLHFMRQLAKLCQVTGHGGQGVRLG